MPANNWTVIREKCLTKFLLGPVLEISGRNEGRESGLFERPVVWLREHYLERIFPKRSYAIFYRFPSQVSFLLSVRFDG